MKVFTGSDINLGLFLTRNHVALASQTVNVTVINQNTGAEILPLTTVPETITPGVYNFLWKQDDANPPPSSPTDLIALFGARSKVFSQSISLLKKQTDGEVVGVVDNIETKGVVNDPENIIGVVEIIEVVGTISDDSVTGVTSDETIFGEVSCE